MSRIPKKVTTAVFPVAGLGTRFLPITKSGPKEMLPIVDRPLIQYVVEEAVAVGIKQLIFVTNGGKRAIEDYFDTNYELEHRLELLNKQEELSALKDIVPDDINIVYIRQSKPLGLGHAVLCAKQIVGDSPFAVLLADDIMDLGAQGCLKKMLEIHEATQSSVIALEKIPLEDTEKYGIVSLSDSSNQDFQKIVSIIEKPKPTLAPSNIAVTGRYILTPRIFTLLEETGLGRGGEIQLTDAIATLLLEEEVFGTHIQGTRFDCGNPLGLLEATITFALKRPDLAGPLNKYLNEIMNKDCLID